MRVLGVDPGLTRCGLGLVEQDARRRITLGAVDVVRTAAETEIPARLQQIADGVEAWLDEHRPDVIALERVFSQHNVRTVMGTAQVSGVVMVAAARRGVPVTLHTPSEMKAAITGSGRADKKQVGRMVARVLGLSEAPRPADAADALALAICHLWRGPAMARLAAAGAAAAKAPRRYPAAVQARDSEGAHSSGARTAVGGHG